MPGKAVGHGSSRFFKQKQRQDEKKRKKAKREEAKESANKKPIITVEEFGQLVDEVIKRRKVSRPEAIALINATYSIK